MIQGTILIVGVVCAALLSIILLCSRGRSRATWLGGIGLLMAVAMEVLDSWTLLASPLPVVLARTSFVIRGIGAVTWLLFSLRYARSVEDQDEAEWFWRLTPLAFIPFIVAVFVPIQTLFEMPTAQEGPLIHLNWLGFSLEALTLILLILALFQLETTLTNAVHGKRWQIKFFVVGVISVLASQLFLISFGLLYRTMDFSMIPARQLGLWAGVCLMGYSHFRRSQDVAIVLSRRQAQRSIVLFAAGLYLLVLGGVGFLMRWLGGGIDRTLMLSLGGLSGLTLIVLLLSESFRLKALQLFRESFQAEKYDYRAQWLAFTRRLASSNSRDDLYKAVLLGFCDTFGMGGAILWLRDMDSKFFSPAGILEMEPADWRLTVGDEVCGPLATTQVPTDLRAYPVSPGSPLVSTLSSLRAAFAVPIFFGDSLDGVILLCRQINKSDSWGKEDLDLMEALASQAQASIHNMRLAEQLAKARDMEVMGKVSTFIAHDLKNLVYTLSLVLENARQHIANPEFQSDMLSSLDNTVSKMKHLISQIRQFPNRESLDLEEGDLKEVVRDAVKQGGIPNVVIEGDSVRATVDSNQMRKVIINLLLNAKEASPPHSDVIVETGNNGSPYLKVSDHGHGMSDEFIRQSLFEPFKTTKAKGMGIGLYQSKHIVEAHGGSLEVQSHPGLGTVFTVRLPLTLNDQNI